ncbi:MAG: hypothetical protein KatS3mg115_0903 [Candidatus Poribacteria bacterium]|nr:MAG: hypothetical protein KatS3mg115_0903 [Candidatus Poribacteria bacterium]
MGERVALILDGGATPGPIPSSVVDVSGEVPRLLREGRIDRERLRSVVPTLELAEENLS